MLALCSGIGRLEWARADISLLEFNLGDDVIEIKETNNFESWFNFIRTIGIEL